MLQSITYAISLLLVLTGLFFLGYVIINRFLFRTGKDEFYTVVVGKEGDKTLPDKVYSAFLQANTLNFSHRKPVFVIDCGIGEDLKKQCSAVIYPDDDVVFIHGECVGSEDEYIVICLDKE